jgi:hypothetical protein
VQVYQSDTETRIASVTEGLNNELKNKLIAKILKCY